MESTWLARVPQWPASSSMPQTVMAKGGVGLVMASSWQALAAMPECPRRR